ncbi:MAG: acyl carrier protein [Verrucomicrobia bacterium]|jgi:acyl carrier protein|nr:acyl carrier protein [Verrucomicrobiota bacterium]
MNDVRQEIRRFVVDQFLFGEEDSLTDDASLLELGVVDSTGVLELVTHIETTYGFKVADEELVPDNLDSIQSLTEFVQRKSWRAPASPPGS